jgi:integrase
MDRPEPGRAGHPAAAPQAAAAAAQPERGARLLSDVWQEDEEFGLYLWAAMTTGARRGELLALRENRFDFEA